MGMQRAVLAGACALGLLGGQLNAQDGARAKADYDWRLSGLNGEARSLDQSRGRVVFINLWATWCSPCIAELESIQRLHDSLAGTPVDFLLVSPERRAPVARFIRRRGHTFPVFLEVDPMPEAFGLKALPTTYVIDREGNVVLKHRGAANWDTEAMRALLRRLAGGVGTAAPTAPPSSSPITEQSP